MDYPKFIPAGNSVNGFNPNEMIDLADIFDDDFFPTDLDFSSFFQEVDNYPRDQTNVHSAPAIQQASQIYNPYSSSGQSDAWIGDNSVEGVRGRPDDDETMDETDWDYLISLGIGPVCTTEDPSGTALLRQSIANPSPAFDQQIINSERVRAAKASARGVIMIPPLMPRSKANPNAVNADQKSSITLIKEEVDSPLVEDVDIKDDPDGDDKGIKKRKKMKSIDPKDMTEEQLLERRERNREHAKKSRIRKRVLLDLLQDQLSALRGENVKLRRVVVDRLPHVATKVFEKCTTEESMLLIDDEDELDEDDEYEGRTDHILGDGNGNSVTISNSNSRRMRKERDRQRRDRILGFFQVPIRPHPDEVLANSALQSSSENKDGSSGAEKAVMTMSTVPKQTARILMEPDFRLIEALIHSQQNFVLSDPSLPDNPIVYCSEGFCRLTGYKRQHILGRNCRFLQGPGTDQGAVDIIRKGVLEGCDISVCLLNYKADGSPFWNQFFVAALKDSAGEIINYVGVQCEVNTLPIEEIKDRVKRLPVPDL